jgi:hypothetical protein
VKPEMQQLFAERKLFATFLEDSTFCGKFSRKQPASNVRKFLNTSAAAGGHADGDCSRLGCFEGKID